MSQTTWRFEGYGGQGQGLRILHGLGEAAHRDQHRGVEHVAQHEKDQEQEEEDSDAQDDDQVDLRDIIHEGNISFRTEGEIIEEDKEKENFEDRDN